MVCGAKVQPGACHAHVLLQKRDKKNGITVIHNSIGHPMKFAHILLIDKSYHKPIILHGLGCKVVVLGECIYHHHDSLLAIKIQHDNR